jgi:hypothetical protein
MRNWMWLVAFVGFYGIFLALLELRGYIRLLVDVPLLAMPILVSLLYRVITNPRKRSSSLIGFVTILSVLLLFLIWILTFTPRT